MIASPARHAVAADATGAPLRTLFVHSGNIFGGVEGVLLATVRHRALAPGFLPEVAVAFDGRFRREAAQAGVPVHDLGAVRFRRPDHVRRARRRLADLLRARHIDVCVTQSGWSHALFAGVARRAKVPVVLWAHGLPNRHHWLEWLSGLTPPDLFVANSGFTAAALRSAFPAARVQVCHAPLELEPFLRAAADTRTRIRAALTTPGDAVVILQASRLEPLKGHAPHLDALARLPPRLPWVCWLAGGASSPSEARYAAALRQRLDRLALGERVRFLGERVDVPALMAAADIYCQPNTGPDTFGLSFVEALAAGLPVITSRLGGALEIVDDTCGRLVPPGDVDALAATLAELLADAPLRSRLGAAGVGRATRLGDPAARLSELLVVLRSVRSPR